MAKKWNARKAVTAVLCLSCATMCAAALAACGNPAQEGGKPALTSGTYWAEQAVQSEAMGNMTYVVHFTLDADANSYYFSCYYVMDNVHAHATFVNTETGTYTDDGANLVFKTEGKSDQTATISDGAFTLDKMVSGMANSYELTYEKGDAPIYVTYYVDNAEYKKVGYKNATDEVVAIAEPDEREGFTFSWGTLPETAGEGANVYGVYTADGGSDNEGSGEEGGESEAALTSGTYWAEKSIESMGGMTYVVHITLDANAGTYYFGCYYVMNNAWTHATIVNAEAGTYTDDGENLVLKTEGEADQTATISDGAFTLDKKVAGFGNSYELTYEKGDAPIYVTYYVDGEAVGKVGYKNADDEVVAMMELDEEDDLSFCWVGVPDAAGTGASVCGYYVSDATTAELASGTYKIDSSWSPMPTAYQIVIDAEQNTFELFSGTNSRGTGTISYEGGVYTLTYTNENTTTFVYNSASGVISFTSKVWIISTITASLNRLDGETFVPYAATLNQDND